MRTILALAFMFGISDPAAVLKADPKSWRPLATIDGGIIAYVVESREHSGAQLICRCRSGSLAAYVTTDSTVVARGDTHDVRLFVDDHPGVDEHWEGGARAGALFAPKPQELANRLVHAHTFAIRLRGPAGRRTLHFDVSGFEGMHAQLRSACPAIIVDELPEAITMVPPEYPTDFAEDMAGTVRVRALVGADGRVRDAKPIASVPLLDDAAVACVRKWTFKPGLRNDKPIEMWVTVPVKFGK